MNKTHVVAIFGYNNTRLYDVKKIKEIVASKLDAGIVLVKKDITHDDLEITPYCLDHKPEDPLVVDILLNYLRDKSLNLIGCLPFSDKGVIGAALVAKRLDLSGDDPATALAMLDKAAFRTLESSLEVSPADYKKPFFKEAFSKTELDDTLRFQGPFFIKPKAEGNSRGCMKISKGSDIEQWLEDNESSLKSGVICEEILSDDNEFSFDGVAGSYWITQKFTTRGAFRAEYQHIMPAPLPKTSTEKIHSVLEPLITNLGSRGGAFHHEFFILSDGRIASVEPNRRPAGMWLWDLATLAFEDFNPWHLWIAHCAGHIKHQGRPIPKTFAGVRGVIVPEDCVLLEADSETLKALLISRFGNGFAKVSLLKKPNDLLRSIPRDNSDFVAFVALTHDNYDQLRNDLDEAAEIVISHLGVTPCVAK